VTDLWPIASAALVTGLLGSAHCLGMCGGISGLFAVNASIRSIRQQIPLSIAYNTGRIATYAFLGIVVAMLGRGAVSSVPDLAAPVRLASGVLIILVGLQVAFGWRLLSLVENVGARLWRRVAPAAKGLVPVENLLQALGLGLIWGLLPCGLVYSVLLLAATTTDSLSGAVVMIAFGLGTMPAMVATGVSASKLAQFMNRRRVGAGLLIILMGIATIAMPIKTLSDSADSMHHGMHNRQ